MKAIGLEELKQLIMTYATSNITFPLFVFGESHEDKRWKLTKKLLGDTYWKISFEDDNPREDIPYCIYNTYYGTDCNSTLLNCIKIAAQIHRPVYCFIDNSVKDCIPQDIISDKDMYVFVDKSE